MMLKSFQCVVRPIIKQIDWNLARNGRTLFVNRAFSSNEAEKAKEAAKSAGSTAKTIFDKIISKEILAQILYEDDKCIAFNDVAPQAPVHFLVIPKQRLDMIENATKDDDNILGHITRIAGELGKSHAPKGFRLVVNNGVEGCQSVYHLHIHVLGGRQLKWPPG